MEQKPRYFIELELVVVFHQFFNFSTYLKIPYILFIFLLFLLTIIFDVIQNQDPFKRFLRQLTLKSFEFLYFNLYLLLQNHHDFFQGFINLNDFNKLLFFLIRLNLRLFCSICQQINLNLVGFDFRTYCLILKMFDDSYQDLSFVNFIMFAEIFQDYFMTKHLYF